MRQVRKTAEFVRGFGGNCADSGANEEPLGGAGDAHCDVAFASERGGFLAFAGEVAWCCSELGLAGLAVDGKVVERL